MSGPNLDDFYGRIARIERDRARGYGFEADGTLGRSYNARPKSRHRSLLWPVLFLLISAFVLKGAIFYVVGQPSYGERVARLQGSESMVELAGGWLMQADPMTTWIAGKIGDGVARIGA